MEILRLENVVKIYGKGGVAVKALDGVELAAPVHVGQVVVENVCGTGADFVACRDLDALGAE